MRNDEDWILEAADGLSVSHELSFSVEVAHERQDLVRGAVRLLSSLAEVRDTYQEDRELIHVDIRVGAEGAVTLAFGDWWDQVTTEAPPWEEAMTRISSKARSVLAPLGFKKRRHLFNREVEPGVVQVVELRHLEVSAGHVVRVEVGIYIERADELIHGQTRRPAWIPEVRCHIRQPLETRSDDAVRGFPMEEPGVVVRFVEEIVVPVLEQLNGLNDIMESSDWGNRPLGWLGGQVALAVLVADQGRPSDARALLQRRFEEAVPRSRGSLHAVIARLGLEPLETGSDPTMSVADEVFVDRWQASTSRRIDELRSLVADLPVRSGKVLRTKRITGSTLDLSSESVGSLWTWILAAVPRVDRLIPNPDPIPPKYRYRHIDGLSDAEQALADLVCAYVGETVRTRVPDAEWVLGGSAELGMKGREFYPLHNQVQKAILWAKSPPATLSDPTDPRYGQLTPTFERALTELA